MNSAQCNGRLVKEGNNLVYVDTGVHLDRRDFDLFETMVRNKFPFTLYIHYGLLISRNRPLGFTIPQKACSSLLRILTVLSGLLVR